MQDGKGILCTADLASFEQEEEQKEEELSDGRDATWKEFSPVAWDDGWVVTTGRAANNRPAISQPPTEQTTNSQAHRAAYHTLKRLMDIVGASFILIVLSPLMLIIALLIRLDSPGKAIFAQERMGYDPRTRKQRPFTMYKFRSMYSNCDQTAHQKYVHDWIHGKLNDDNHIKKMTNDQRVTRLGHILRKTSLDELPQLWNVLRGEMSLVGPRPVPLYEVAEYEPWHRKRLEAKPGITGWWQVKGRGWVTLDEMAHLDIEYINHQSIWLDLKILFLTIPVMIQRRGAA
jgi:lipopolysaccharide/colanic/teichoic acid biosynthesis glycosyltransferase